MVQVRNHHPVQEQGTIQVEYWVDDLLSNRTFTEAGARETLVAACELARDAEEKSGSERWTPTVSSFRTGLEMAEILAELHLHDIPSLVAAILYRVVRESRLSVATVRNRFGEQIAALIESEDPDILLLMETDATWHEALREVLSRYDTVLALSLIHI